MLQREINETKGTARSSLTVGDVRGPLPKEVTWEERGKEERIVQISRERKF